MGTSQSAVARIESGDDNITVSTLKRLVDALEGRIRFAIEPKELSLPRWGEWWELVSAGLGAGEWGLQGAEERRIGNRRVLVGGWADVAEPLTTTSTTTFKPELSQLGQAS